MTISSLLVAHGAHAQGDVPPPPPLPAPAPELPSLPVMAPLPSPTVMTHAEPAPSTTVAVSAPGATVDCGNVRVELRCPRMELTQPGIRPAPKTQWYGWQTLIADGASLAMLFGAVAARNDAAGTWAGAAGVTYMLGGPVVHWAHGHGLKGAASLGLRVGMPVGLGLLGLVTGSALDSGRGYAGGALGALGFVVGIPAAIAIDAAVVAREDVPEDDAEAASVHAQAQAAVARPWLQVQPDVQTSRNGAQVGVRGMF